MIVVTAGHVDHGKSTLVKLITGTDPDRLAEEQRRGLTIELGFAFASLPSGRPLAFIDVPGHERFIRTMLGGCGSHAVALLVVSAVEGWMPQTEEHAEILRLFGLTRGVVAMTHVDLVDERAAATAMDGIRRRLEGSFLASSPIVPTSETQPATVASLVTAIDLVDAGVPPADEPQERPRLWIDRSFLLRGHGRVVTGTLLGGPISRGDQLVAVRGATAVPVRVRSLHVDAEPLATARSGTRVALNLADAPPLLDGGAIVRAGDWLAGTTLHCTFETVRSLARSPHPRRSYRLFVGTTAAQVRLHYVEGGQSAGESQQLVRLRSSQPIGPIAIGDRYVLRDESDQRTVGGGTLLAINDGRARRPLDQLWARFGVLTGTGSGAQVDGLARLVLEQHGGSMPTRALRRIVGPTPTLAVVGSNTVLDPVSAPGCQHAAAERGSGSPTWDGDAVQSIGELLGARMPPLVTRSELFGLAGLAPGGIDAFVQHGVLVEVGPFLMAADDFAAVATAVVDHLGAGRGATVSDLRKVTGLSRKYLVPLLECLDRRGHTRRVGNLRVLPEE